MNMKYALCNELFGKMDLAASAEITRKAGYGGIEFAPYTVFGSFSPADVQAGIKNIKLALTENDLSFVGFHWLMVGPQYNVKGEELLFSLVSPDKARREIALDRIKLLLSAAGELGGGVLILGSPKSRGSVPGQSAEEAFAIFRDGISSLGDFAVSCNSILLPEHLDHGQCNVLNTLEEAQDIVNYASSPGISGMFDFHNSGDETESWEALIRKYKEIIKHVHINEWDGGPPGTGKSDYAPSFRTLREIGFDGWVSMEIFSEPENPALLITDALEFMLKTEKAL